MRTLVLVFDSLREDAAQQSDDLSQLLSWDSKTVSLAQAPYTPSSLTTIVTGLHPSQHQFWDFPTRHAQATPPPATDYIFPALGIPVAWASTCLAASYAWPRAYAIPTRVNAVKWLKRHSDGLMFVHIWESHAPYSYDHGIDECINTMREMGTVAERIDYVNKGVAAGVEEVKPLLDALSGDDIVIVMGDHGEALGETNPITGEQSWLHQHITPQEIVVPFWVHGHDLDASVMRHCDIYNYLAHDIYQMPGERKAVFGFELESWAISRWRYRGSKFWSEHGLVYYDDGWTAAAENHQLVSGVTKSHGDEYFLQKLGSYAEQSRIDVLV